LTAALRNSNLLDDDEEMKLIRIQYQYYSETDTTTFEAIGEF
jgi:hypothetical protein